MTSLKGGRGTRRPSASPRSHPFKQSSPKKSPQKGFKDMVPLKQEPGKPDDPAKHPEKPGDDPGKKKEGEKEDPGGEEEGGPQDQVEKLEQKIAQLEQKVAEQQAKGPGVIPPPAPMPSLEELAGGKQGEK